MRVIKLTGDGALLFGRNFGDAAVGVREGIGMSNLLRLTRVAAVHCALSVSGQWNSSK